MSAVLHCAFCWIHSSVCVFCLQATAGDGEDVDMDEALGNKKNASSGKQPTQQIAGNLCPPSESKGANGDSDMVSPQDCVE